MPIRPGPINWREVHRVLLKKYRPWEIRLLTLAEVAMELEGDGPADMNDAQIAAEVSRWRAMGPLERLRNFQR